MVRAAAIVIVVVVQDAL